jgi:hypothetical protein
MESGHIGDDSMTEDGTLVFSFLFVQACEKLSDLLENQYYT